MSDSHDVAEFEVAASYSSEEEARQAAARLLLKGMGAATEPGPDGFCVMVVPGQGAQAAEILGVTRDQVADEPERTRSQVVPPSFDRYTPRVACASYECPSTAAKTMSGLVGWTRSLLMTWESARPTCAQVLPASVVL